MIGQRDTSRGILLLGTALFLGTMTVSCNRAGENSPATPSENIPAFHELTGPYLGQEPPGNTRELFAPGILSDGLFNGLVYFTAGGNEVYFSSGFERPFYISVLFHSFMEDGKWTEPVEFPVERSVFHRPVLGPDGTKVVFISSEAEDVSESDSSLTRIYIAEKTQDGWSAPEMIDFGETFPYSVGQASVASNGNLYFQAGYYIDGDEDIYLSIYEDGNYLPPIRLSDAVNGPEHDVHPFIAPDESYLIFDSARPEGFGDNDLYISFRNSMGEWTEAQNMGQNVNTLNDERRASVSFDGRYLFFESQVPNAVSRLPEPPLTLNALRNFYFSAENGGADVYWMDATVIEELRPSLAADQR